MWVQFFLLKNKMIHETHLPLLFTVSRGQLAGYYENFYRSFNLKYELFNETYQNYYVTIPAATQPPGLPYQCFSKSSPRNTSSVRRSVPSLKSFMVKGVKEISKKLHLVQCPCTLEY